MKNLISQQLFDFKFLKFFSIQRNLKYLIFINFLSSFFAFEIANADTNKFITTENNPIKIEYLDSKNELEDYIIDTGDSISIEFFPAQELSGIFPVNEEGELFLPRLYETYVRGLTLSEVKNLLEKKYAEFLIDPDIKVRIAIFKTTRVSISGEVRNPGLLEFPSFKSVSFLSPDQNSIKNKNVSNSSINLLNAKAILKQNNQRLTENNNNQLKIGLNSSLDDSLNEKFFNKISDKNVITISDVIRKAGGITSESDLSRIEIIRDIPLGKGGGKKKAIIDFNAYLNKLDPTNDIRIFDGDKLFIPRLTNPKPSQISKSILSGISPKYISVNVTGRIENPGVIRLPLEATLSDVIDLTGPVRPLSGKVVLIRYEKDGKLSKKNISYSSGSKRGSSRNPFVKDGDLISIKNSVFGKTTGFVKEVTAPFTGIYSIKKLIDDFNE